MRAFKSYLVIVSLLLLTACSFNKQTGEQYDYSAFKQSNPRSILVLPPVNKSPDVDAVNGMLSTATYPLAESGYYVFPVAVVQKMLHENSLNTSEDIHAIKIDKLREIFGADAVLYITVLNYGTSYRVIDSVTNVVADARLIDTKTGTEIWSGRVSMDSRMGSGSSNSLVGMLVNAAVKQVVGQIGDHAYDVAVMASNKLLTAGGADGLLYGPRSPHYSGFRNSGELKK